MHTKKQLQWITPRIIYHSMSTQVLDFTGMSNTMIDDYHLVKDKHLIIASETHCVAFQNSRMCMG